MTLGSTSQRAPISRSACSSTSRRLSSAFFICLLLCVSVQPCSQQELGNKAMLVVISAICELTTVPESLFLSLFMCFLVTLCSTSVWAIFFSGERTHNDHRIGGRGSSPELTHLVDNLIVVASQNLYSARQHPILWENKHAHLRILYSMCLVS